MELKLEIRSSGGRDILLLIVPYGIETVLSRCIIEMKKLLIVPYGIETKESAETSVAGDSFNRTLWN